MSSLCLLSVDDVYEQYWLAAECLMVHKIKPRLSAVLRLPSGSHVVKACWEYKFQTDNQVNTANSSFFSFSPSFPSAPFFPCLSCSFSLSFMESWYVSHLAKSYQVISALTPTHNPQQSPLCLAWSPLPFILQLSNPLPPAFTPCLPISPFSFLLFSELAATLLHSSTSSLWQKHYPSAAKQSNKPLHREKVNLLSLWLMPSSPRDCCHSKFKSLVSSPHQKTSISNGDLARDLPRRALPSQFPVEKFCAKN